jgi:predicted transposase YbfD/YdcC
LERVFKHLDSKELEQCFKTLLGDLSLAGRQLILDGKELRSTVPKGKKHALVRLVNVWVEELSLSFGQQKVDRKSNEITAIPALLDLLDCRGSVVSIDAMGCQRNIVEKIRARGADYVIALKANQGALYEQVRDFMSLRTSLLPADTTLDKGHDRGEIRKVYLAQDLQFIEESLRWPDLKTLVMVERSRILADRVEKHTQFYISSLDHSDPTIFAHYIRRHWSIENNLHWQLDVTFKEDEAKVRNHTAIVNLHQIRKWALYLLKKDPSKISIKRKRKKASRSPEYLKTILS